MLEIYRSFLQQHVLTSNVSSAQQETLYRAIHPHAVAPSEHLFQQGDPAQRFFLLVSGQVKLYRVSQEGQEKVVEIVQPGGSFAEAVMFMQQKIFPVNAQATKTSEVLSVNTNVYRQLLTDNPAMSFHLLADLSMRLHSRLNEIETLTLQNATYRVIRYFISQIPADTHGAFELHLPASKRLIASHLAIQPETFSRILTKLRDEGIIRVNGRKLCITDKDLLFKYT